jgi:glycosyltransferase involved in cell wall biosynthesis
VRDADLTVAVSNHAAAMATEAGAEGDTVVVVPNGVDLDEIARAVAAEVPKGGPGPPRIGWIGSFGPWHGAEVLVRALAVLAAKAELVMVGDGVERRRCQQLADQLGVGSRIEWTGVLPHEEALRRLSACDILASPHIPLSDRPFFGSPTKLFEYMGLGKPIVASRLEQLGEVLEDGRTAVLVDPGDPRQFAEGVMRVLQLPDRGEALGRAARAQAAAEHTWEHRAQAVLRRLDADSMSNATGPAVARNPGSPCAG